MSRCRKAAHVAAGFRDDDRRPPVSARNRIQGRQYRLERDDPPVELRRQPPNRLIEEIDLRQDLPDRNT